MYRLQIKFTKLYSSLYVLSYKNFWVFLGFQEDQKIQLHMQIFS